MGNFANGFAIAGNEVLRDGRLSRDARCLYACLCGYADSDRKCYPSVATLCKNLNCGEKSFRKYRAELEKYGYLLIQARTGEKGQLSNMYILQDVAPENRTGGSKTDTPGTNDRPVEPPPQPLVKDAPAPMVEQTGQTDHGTSPSTKTNIYLPDLAETVCTILNANRQRKGGSVSKGRVTTKAGERYIRDILEAGHTAAEIIDKAKEGSHTDWYWLREALK